MPFVVMSDCAVSCNQIVLASLAVLFMDNRTTLSDLQSAMLAGWMSTQPLSWFVMLAPEPVCS